VQINTRWKVVDGNHWLLDFDQKRTAAERAVSVGLSSLCFVGRPACGDVKPMTYWLTASHTVPSGAMANEDAIPLDPAHVQVRKIGERWKVADGNNWLLDFGPAEGNAKAALFFIKKYEFRFICFCGRPHPGMVYFRK
jgi:hypothetical protein